MPKKPTHRLEQHLLTGYEVGLQGDQILLRLKLGTKPGLEDGPVVSIPLSRKWAATMGSELLKAAGIQRAPEQKQ